MQIIIGKFLFWMFSIKNFSIQKLQNGEHDWKETRIFFQTVETIGRNISLLNLIGISLQMKLYENLILSLLGEQKKKNKQLQEQDPILFSFASYQVNRQSRK